MSSSGFAWRHFPVLFIGTTATLGGIMPMALPEFALKEFGFPDRIAQSPAAHPVIVMGANRGTALGVLMWTFYLQGKFTEMYTTLAVMSTWVGAVDAFTVFRHGKPGKAIFRFCMSSAFAVYAWCGVFGRF